MAKRKGVRRLFGEIASALEYTTAKDLEAALDIQRQMDVRGEPHKLLGIIMLQQGMISSEQLIKILKEMEKERGQSPVT
jgi:hypothetical protein